MLHYPTILTTNVWLKSQVVKQTTQGIIKILL